MGSRLPLLVIMGALLAASVTSAETVPVFGGCVSKVQVRPRSIMFACGDGNFFVTGLRWARWDAREAAAAGTGHQNDCAPDCARGHFHAYAVAVRLSVPVACVGLNEFTKLSWRFLRAKPAHVARGGTESFSCQWRKVRS